VASGDTAWVLVSAALVLFMTPGLALFYGGMARVRGVLSVMMMSIVSIGVVTVLWTTYGFSLAYGRNRLGGLIGGVAHIGLRNMEAPLAGLRGLHVSPSTLMVFQLMFAIITAALISGGVIDRIRFTSFIVVIVAWFTLVYVPLAHWVFSPEGWLAQRGVLDFAGGTVVEINSGFSALAIVLVIGRRHGWPREPMQPHSVPFTLLGAGILWFGWFGFNAGSALDAGHVAVSAFVNTQLAAAGGLLVWLIVEAAREGAPTTLGAASGAIAGMVAITPCVGFVGPMPALLIGAVAGLLCALAVRLKFRLGYDDSLDVLGVHGVGGVVGMLLLGLFAARSVNAAGSNGLFSGGGFRLLGEQALATAVAIAFCFVVTYLIAQVVDRTMGLRVAPDLELEGLDLGQHAETAYSGLGAGGSR